MTTILIQVNFTPEKTNKITVFFDLNKKQELNFCFLSGPHVVLVLLVNNSEVFISIADFVYDPQRNAFQDKHICNSLLFKLRRHSY